MFATTNVLHTFSPGTPGGNQPTCITLEYTPGVHRWVSYPYVDTTRDPPLFATIMRLELLPPLRQAPKAVTKPNRKRKRRPSPIVIDLGTPTIAFPPTNSKQGKEEAFHIPPKPSSPDSASHSSSSSSWM